MAETVVESSPSPIKCNNKMDVDYKDVTSSVMKCEEFDIKSEPLENVSCLDQVEINEEIESEYFYDSKNCNDIKIKDDVDGMNNAASMESIKSEEMNIKNEPLEFVGDGASDMECTPPEVKEAAIGAGDDLFPKKSKEMYEYYYSKFMEWRNEKNIKSFSETAILAYFVEISNKMKPPTLWKIYSMLNTTIGIKHNTNIATYAKLHAFLKRKSNGYRAKKIKFLTAEEAEKFINEAPDSIYLAIKVVLIIGMIGACRKCELYKMKIDDVQDLGEVILFKVPNTKTKSDRKFKITGEFCKIIKKYLALRPPNIQRNNFFLKYYKGYCVNQVIGINNFGLMPQAIAKYLHLKNPELYTGRCFRGTSARWLMKSGANKTTLKCYGGKSTGVAKSYIDHTLNNKISVANNIRNCVEQTETTNNASTSRSANTSSQSVVHENCTELVVLLYKLRFYVKGSRVITYVRVYLRHKEKWRTIVRKLKLQAL